MFLCHVLNLIITTSVLPITCKKPGADLNNLFYPKLYIQLIKPLTFIDFSFEIIINITSSFFPPPTPPNIPLVSKICVCCYMCILKEASLTMETITENPKNSKYGTQDIMWYSDSNDISTTQFLHLKLKGHCRKIVRVRRTRSLLQDCLYKCQRGWLHQGSLINMAA